MAIMASTAEIPAELQPATIIPDAPSTEREGRDEASGVWPAGSSPGEGQNVRIAHVLAGDDGVEDVEVSVHCPHCDGAILVDVASEDALQTAFSLLHGGEPPAPGDDDDVDLRPAEARPRSGPPAAAADDDLDLPIARQLMSFLRRVSVADAMEPSVCFVHARSAVGNLSQVFAQSAPGFALVTDAEHRPVGVVTPAHLMRALFSMDPKRLDRATVEDVMTPTTFCVRADAPLCQAAELVRQQGAQSIAVVGDDGKLIGVLEPKHLLTAVLSPKNA